ncbi:MAG: Ig-like domain-containing protein [Vicinamibacteria bacterium]
MRIAKPSRLPLAAAAAAVSLALAATGCGLDKVQTPPLIGPSETGYSVQLTALPDTLNADGVSVSTVQLVLRDAAGKAVSGRAVLFEFNGDGTLVPSANSSYVGPIQSGIVMATDKNGVANVVYVAGSAVTTVVVGVRPYGIDAANGFYRTVEIFQR